MLCFFTKKEGIMKKACITGLVALVLMSAPAFAQKVIRLSPKESKSLTNSTLWTLNATCNIQTKQDKHVILVSMVENKGEVNGKSLSKGQSTSVNVKSNDNISVSAEPGSTVKIVNMSKDSVEADCNS